MFQNTFGTEWTSTEASAKDRSDRRGASTTLPQSAFVFEVDGATSLQDITAEESRSNLGNVYLHFESRKHKKTGQNKQGDLGKYKSNLKEQQQTAEQRTPVQITSFVADSETAVTMNAGEESNKTGGDADMISAFFVAPEDEVNEIEKPPFSGRPIVVSDLKEDLVRNERYSTKDGTKPLTNNILAPIRAAVTLSHDKEAPTIEKQVLREMPVYKTFIEIQKAIPYELKEVEQKEARPVGNELTQPQQHLQHHLHQQPQIVQQTYQRPQFTTAAIRPSLLLQRYPMYYYVPHGYIGNYVMKHSYENTGYRHPRPIQYLLKYQPQLYAGLVLGHPAYYIATPATDDTADLNVLQSESRPFHAPPFRPSHPVYTSQYPPYTYRVMMHANSRGAHARAARSKQLCIEYGGFKPPMVPSVQIEEALAEQAHQALALDDYQEK